MFARGLLLAVLLQVSEIALAKPTMELTEALRLARAYVAEHKIANEDRYLASATWHEDFDHPEKSCWSILWASNEPRVTDSELVVWVYEDGRIRYQDAWA
jgi:hypothetical protein